MVKAKGFSAVTVEAQIRDEVHGVIPFEFSINREVTHFSFGDVKPG
jgi:hypothetical protein